MFSIHAAEPGSHQPESEVDDASGVDDDGPFAAELVAGGLLARAVSRRRAPLGWVQGEM